MQTPNVKKKAENISTAQIEKIRRNLRFALLTLSQQIPEKEREQFKKDVHGLKYKSSSTKIVYLSVPKRKQKAIIDKHYLKKINDLFNRNGKTKYKLEIVVSKPNVWIPILCGGLATTLAATGTAVYFALTPVMVTMTLNLVDAEGVEGEIPGFEGHIVEYTIKKGSKVSEIPTPVTDESTKKVFHYWESISQDNTRLWPRDEITSDMKLRAHYKPAEGSIDVYVHLQGGTLPSIEGDEGTIKVADGAVYGDLPTPDYPEHHFNGWSLTAEGEIIPDNTPIPTTGVEIYAVYEDVQHVYTINGGSTSISIDDTDEGSDTAWAMYEDGKPITGNVSWALETGAPSGLSINAGVLSWNKVDIVVGGYDITITATRGTDTAQATTHIDVNSTKVHISFDKTDTTIEYTGQTEFDIIMSQPDRYEVGEDPGTTFGQISIPAVEKNRSHFVEWQFVSGGTGTVDENTVFPSNATIKPVFEGDPITYHLDGGATLLEGYNSVAGKDENAWVLKNQYGETIQNPIFTLTGAETSDIWLDNTNFVNWRKGLEAKSYNLEFQAKLTSAGEVVASQQIVLVIDPASLTFTLPASTTTWGTITYDPAVTSYNFHYDATFGSIKYLLPTTVTCSGQPTYAFDFWTATDGGTTEITDETKVQDINASQIIYPHFSEVEDPTKQIVITGADKIQAGRTTTYTATTYPVGRTVTWSIQAGDTTGSTINSTTGVLTAGGNPGTCTIIATSADGMSETKNVIIDYPYVDSNKIWGYANEESAILDEGWYWIDTTSACGSGQIQVTRADDPLQIATAVDRNEFDLDITIGDRVTTIGNNFLNTCIGFNSDITFAPNSICNKICDNFMSDCTQFSHELVLPDTIGEIGDNFLYKCSAFANLAWDEGEEEWVPQDFAIPSNLGTIGDGFLYECHSFNSNMVLTSQITEIGNTFMYGCTSMSTGVTPGIITLAEGFKYQAFASSSETALSFAEVLEAGETSTHRIHIICGDSATQTGMLDKFGKLTPGDEGGFYRDLNITQS